MKRLRANTFLILMFTLAVFSVISEGLAETLSDYVTRIYLKTLKRKPTDAELIGWVNRISTGAIKSEELPYELEKTDEYRRLHKMGPSYNPVVTSTYAEQKRKRGLQISSSPGFKHSRPETYSSTRKDTVTGSGRKRKRIENTALDPIMDAIEEIFRNLY